MKKNYYAQLDDKNYVIGVISLNNEKKSSNYIQLKNLDISLVGKKYNFDNQEFEECEIPYILPSLKEEEVINTEDFIASPAPDINSPIELTQQDKIELTLLSIQEQLNKILNILDGNVE